MKQVVDQSAHAGIGFAASYFLSDHIGLFSIPVVFGIALVREFKQHKGEKLGKGSLLDMTFWTLGAIGGVGVGNI